MATMFSWARGGRALVATAAALCAAAQLAAVEERLAGDHVRLVQSVAGSVVLCVVRALREARSPEMLLRLLVAGVALGVLVGLALEVLLRRDGGHEGCSVQNTGTPRVS